jgi:hypothetical protein
LIWIDCIWERKLKLSNWLTLLILLSFLIDELNWWRLIQSLDAFFSLKEAWIDWWTTLIEYLMPAWFSFKEAAFICLSVSLSLCLSVSLSLCLSVSLSLCLSVSLSLFLSLSLSLNEFYLNWTKLIMMQTSWFGWFTLTKMKLNWRINDSCI